MKVVAVQDAKMDQCVREARRDHVVITRNGKPVAMVVPLVGMGLEQVDIDLQGMFEKILPKNTTRREMTVAEARKGVCAARISVLRFATGLWI